MYFPKPGDYIDIHTHGAAFSPGIFAVENLMAHEHLQPENIQFLAFTAGIHPWYLTEINQGELLDYVTAVADNENLIALGEAGFDKLRGPSGTLQKEVFEQQAYMAKERKLPLVIHCVKAWEELFSAHRDLKPSVPWLIHGFRGKKDLAFQLLNRGMYLSFWFDFIIRPESSELLRSLPGNRIFLETDGADISIKEIYKKAAADLAVKVEELRERIFLNYNDLFGAKHLQNLNLAK